VNRSPYTKNAIKIDDHAAYLLYLQAYSLLACMDTIEEMGLKEQFPNYDKCRADVMKAIFEAEKGVYHSSSIA